MFVRKTCQCLSGLIFQLDAQLLHFLPQDTQTAASCSIMQYHAVSLNESCNIIQPSPWNLLGDGMFSLRSLISDSDGVQKAEAGAILQPSHQPQANLRESVVARFSYTFHIETV